MVRVLIRRVGGGMEPPRVRGPPRPLYFTIHDNLSSVCYGGKQHCHLAIIASKLSVTQHNGE